MTAKHTPVYYTPVKLAPLYVTARGIADMNQAEIEERAPVCGMTREKAVAYALTAYGADAAIENDYTHDVEVV